MPLVEELELNGLRHEQALSADQLLQLVARAPGAPVVVYDAVGGDLARSVLASLGESCRQIPVIVVVNAWNLDDHYELLCLGAYDYFALSEGLGVIESAVRWAVRRETGALWGNPRCGPQTPKGKPASL